MMLTKKRIGGTQRFKTSDDIDAFVHDMTVANGAYPSPLDYKGFPKACCTSVNNVVAHGIPDE